MRIFRPLMSAGRLDFLAVPAPHLRAGVAAGEVHDVVLVIKLAHEFHAVAIVEPGGQLAAVHPKWDGGADGKGIVLPEIVVRRGMAGFDRALLHRIDHAERGHQLARGVHGDLELATRHRLELIGEDLGRAVDGVQRLRKARRQAPANGGLRMHGRRGRGGQRHPPDLRV
jgi:hypothetical protein